MKEELSSIQTRLSGGRLRYVDEDWGQLDDYAPNPPSQFPCCLIDITDANFEDVGRDRQARPENRQTAQTIVTLTFASLRLTNTSGRAPQRQKDAAWEIWDVIEEAHQKLHGWKPSARSGAMMRINHKRVVRDDGIQEYKVMYSMGATNV